jgi:hypothetical protein
VCKRVQKKLERTLARWAVTSLQKISCIIWTEKGVWENMWNDGRILFYKSDVANCNSLIHYERFYVLRGSKRGMYRCGSGWTWPLFIYRKECAYHDRLILTNFQDILPLC